MTSLRCSSAPGQIGDPKWTSTRWRRAMKRRRLGQLWPGGIASYVPLTKIGTIGMPCCFAMTAAPERISPSSPPRERVPSGNISRFQRVSSSMSTCAVDPFPIPPPCRASGTVLKMSATMLATARFL